MKYSSLKFDLFVDMVATSWMSSKLKSLVDVEGESSVTLSVSKSGSNLWMAGEVLETGTEVSLLGWNVSRPDVMS